MLNSELQLQAKPRSSATMKIIKERRKRRRHIEDQQTILLNNQTTIIPFFLLKPTMSATFAAAQFFQKHEACNPQFISEEPRRLVPDPLQTSEIYPPARVGAPTSAKSKRMRAALMLGTGLFTQPQQQPIAWRVREQLLQNPEAHSRGSPVNSKHAPRA